MDLDAICLKANKNISLLYANCLRCHSDKIICQQNLNKKAWDKTLLWMEKEHGLTFPSKSVRVKILKYLSTYYGDSSYSLKHEMANRPVNPLPILSVE